MKKIIIAITAFFVLATQSMAQRFIDVYQGGKVTGSMLSTDIDSVNITGDDAYSRSINFWRAGQMTNNFLISTVDSINVFRVEEKPLVYLGILGFNRELYTKPMDVIATSTYNTYDSFVSKLWSGNGSILYYAVDNALDMISESIYPTDLGNVMLITFTDGLDQGSLMLNSDYQTEEEYLNHLNQRITSMTVQGLPLTAYSIGLRGNDVTNYYLFQENLRKLASSEDKAIEVSKMGSFQNYLQEFADNIISVSNVQTISMTIPGQSNGTHICFTFDGLSPEYSSMYIEGVFNLADRSLREVTYHGMRGTSGSTVQGTQEGIFITYTFTGLQRTDSNGVIPTDKIRQYNKANGSSVWQINSEFKPENDTQSSFTHSGSAIILVLDCSSSLGMAFYDMRQFVKDFLSRVANNVEDFSLNAPTKVRAAMNNDDKGAINISWDAVKYAQSYNVYRNSNTPEGFTLVAEGVTSTNWKDEDADGGRSFYKICAVGYGLTSEKSEASDTISIYHVETENFDDSIRFHINDVEFKMIKVDGGTFQMGSKKGEENEKPVHEVTLSDYYIGETEVTQGLWYEIMGSNPSRFMNPVKRPVDNISWYDCQDFISKLNEATGMTFRMPTEAEWEFAARGGNASEGYEFSGSDILTDVAWFNSMLDWGVECWETHEVATKAPNELGIYDMSGNVREWCSDWYGKYNSEAESNPTGPSNGTLKIARGGYYLNNHHGCTVTYRCYPEPTYKNDGSGLRIVLQ